MRIYAKYCIYISIKVMIMSYSEYKLYQTNNSSGIVNNLCKCHILLHPYMGIMTPTHTSEHFILDSPAPFRGVFCGNTTRYNKHSFLFSDARLMEDYKSGRLVLLQDRNNTLNETATVDLYTLKQRFINVYLNGSLENIDYSYVFSLFLPVREDIGLFFCHKLPVLSFDTKLPVLLNLVHWQSKVFKWF